MGETVSNAVNAFADAGATYNPSRITSYELYTIRADPFLCSQTTFYEGNLGNLPKVNLQAHVEICGN